MAFIFYTNILKEHAQYRYRYITSSSLFFTKCSLRDTCLILFCCLFLNIFHEKIMQTIENNYIYMFPVSLKYLRQKRI
jgi:hypothetical protein